MARPKGSPNKRSGIVARRLLDEFDLDPARELARLLVNSDDPEFRAARAKELMPYCYPQLKAVEVTGDDGGPLKATVTLQFLRPDGSITTADA